MSGFEDFVSIELPKRPFVSVDGSPGQVLIRSTRPERPRELEWANIPGIIAPQTYVAAVPLSGHSVVLLDISSNLIYADNESEDHAHTILGLTRGAVATGDSTEVARNEEVYEPSWSWIPGRAVYLGKSGGLTQTPPVLPAVFSLTVGWAISPNRVFISIGTPIFLS